MLAPRHCALAVGAGSSSSPSWPNKRGCQDYFRGEKKRKLREVMFQGNTNDPCLPKQYKVKEIEEIWGLRYASPT